MKKIILVTIFICIPRILIAETTFVDWSNIKTLKCKFTEGATFNGRVKLEKEPFGQDDLIIDSINLQEKSARLIGNVGGDDLTVLDAGNMLTLMSVTPTGNLIFTSILQSPENIYITMSRHVTLGQNPIFSQNYGTCKIWN
jgi:hypothetical protein